MLFRSNVVAQPGVAAVRAYIGVDTSQPAGQQVRLILVGVDSEGRDMTNERAGQKPFDYTTPCPPMCDLNSPLNVN